MKLSTVQKLYEKAVELGIPAQIREAYSGRGMFGRETPAIVVEERDDVMKLALLVVSDIEEIHLRDDFTKEMSNGRWDNMGMGYIYY